MTSLDELSKKTFEGAKQLAPWRSSLPWWVAFLEGIIIAIIGLLIILDPNKANVRLSLILSLALFVSGFFQFLDLNRSRAPENVDGTMGARAGVGMFAGLVALVLWYLDQLTVQGGLIILGLGSLIYGVLGFFLVFNSVGAQRRVAIVESLLYVAVGALALYALFGGADEIASVVSILGWIALIAGSAIAVFGFLRRGHDDEIQDALDTVSETTASVTSTLTGKRPDSTQPASQVQDAVDDLNRPSDS